MYFFYKAACRRHEILFIDGNKAFGDSSSLGTYLSMHLQTHTEYYTNVKCLQTIV